MNIKCITYSRYSTGILIYTLNQEKSNKQIFKDAEKMPSKMKALKSKVNEREKLRTGYGVWYATCDQNDICYAVCTTETYPERHAFGLMQKIKDKIKTIDHCEYQTEQNIKEFSKDLTNKLGSQYNDLSKVDKLYKATSQVKMLESQLNVGIKKLMNNQQSLSDMDDKASKMKSYANQFHQNSQKLQRMLYWRNMKLKIFIALCVIGLLGFAILIIVQVTSNGSSNNNNNNNNDAINATRLLTKYQ